MPFYQHNDDMVVPTAENRFSDIATAMRELPELGEQIPLNSIEGIDRDHARALKLQGIENVQNLATANPLLLLVDSPFGLYCEQFSRMTDSGSTA